MASTSQQPGEDKQRSEHQSGSAESAGAATGERDAPQSEAAGARPDDSVASDQRGGESVPSGDSDADRASQRGMPGAGRGGADTPRPFLIVGVGASAGGLESLEELFGAMPADTGMAFVVVTHQHPGHTSMLPDLLRRATEIPVVEAADGTEVRPNHVYVGLPGGQLVIRDAFLVRVDADETEAPRLPIDHFLRSLAEDQAERAVCIILSGTGSDGTLGLRTVKAASGMAMVQQPESAKYAGMPNSALGTGLTDFVLEPGAMAAKLIAYARGKAPVKRATEPGQAAASSLSPEPAQRLFRLLRRRTGHDFAGYKESTIRRRIERRMNLHQQERLQDYVRLLQERPEEADALFRELLISVTSFFRDAEAWDVLARALPDLLASRDQHRMLRAWVPGCATGEEAYSLAILLDEAIEASHRPFELQVFGTDLDAQAIQVARAGQYPEGIAADLSPARLERYFARSDSSYRINKAVRDKIVFSEQNIVRDPPFINLDLIACRNLLIYFKSDLQRQLVPLLHYALAPGGLLFLGPSEGLSQFEDRFEAIDKRWRVYRRGQGPADLRGLATVTGTGGRRQRPQGEETEGPAEPRQSGERQTSELVDQLLLARYAPASLVVKEGGEVVFIHGRTGAFLEPAAGQPRFNVHDMAREGLKLALAAALREAAGRKQEVTHEAVRVRTNGEEIHCDLSVTPIAEPADLHGLFLIAFRQRPAPAAAGAHEGEAPAEDARVQQLERELQHTKESLQTSIEELETSNEEVKSTNEELQSTNEELQSSNEELETSREELQSLNEELNTVNAELQAKVEELSRSNDDMQNLLDSIEIATIFLDRQLRIKRYTDEARELVRLIESDVGRPLTDLVHHLEYERLVPDCREVLRTLVFKQEELRSQGGHWYLMRIMPYRTAENVIEGLVLTFVDIDPIKRAEEDLAAAKERLAADLEAMNRLHEIGIHFLRGRSREQILEEVLDAAILIDGTDLGLIQLVEPGSDALRIAAQRGLKRAWRERWDADDSEGNPFDAALRRGERTCIADTDNDRRLAETARAEVLEQAGVRALQAVPLMGHNDELHGVILTLFREPFRPDSRREKLCDLLARQTAEILEHSQAGHID